MLQVSHLKKETLKFNEQRNQDSELGRCRHTMV